MAMRVSVNDFEEGLTDRNLVLGLESFFTRLDIARGLTFIGSGRLLPTPSPGCNYIKKRFCKTDHS